MITPFKACPGASLVAQYEESTCQCRRHEFDPWSRKSPYAKEQLGPSTAAPQPRPLESRGHSPEPWAAPEAQVPASLCSATRGRPCGEKPPRPGGEATEQCLQGSEDSAQPEISE